MEERIEAWLRARDAARFRRDIDSSAAAVRRLGTESETMGLLQGKAAQAGQRMHNVGLGMVSVLGAIGRAGRVAGIGLGIVGAGAVKVGFGFNKMIDGQRVAFETLLKSKKEAKAFMHDIRRLAFRSPVLDPETTGNAARTLMAYGLQVKDTLPFVKALGDMSAATGKSIAEVMPRGAMAIGQIGSKGKLQTEELNQLAESVGLSRKRIAKELGMTKDEFAATFTAGNNLSSTKALPAILKAMQHQAGGAAKELSKTTSGRFDQFREMMKMKLGGMTRPLWNLAGKLMHGLTQRLRNFNPKEAIKNIKVLGKGFSAGLSGKSGSQTAGFSGLAGVAVKIGKAFHDMWPIIKTVGKALVQAGKDMIDAFKPGIPFFKNILLPLLKGIAIGVIGGIVVAFKVTIKIVKGVMTVLGWLGEKLAFLKPVFETLGKIIGFVFGGAILKVFGFLGKLGGVAKFVGGILRGFGKGALIVAGMLMHLWDKIKKVAGIVAGAFADAFKTVGGVVKDVFNGIVGFIKDRLNDIIGVINTAIRAFNKLPGPNIGEIGLIGASDPVTIDRRAASGGNPIINPGANDKGNRPGTSPVLGGFPATDPPKPKAKAGSFKSRRSVTPIGRASMATRRGPVHRSTHIVLEVRGKQLSEALLEEVEDEEARS